MADHKRALDIAKRYIELDETGEYTPADIADVLGGIDITETMRAYLDLTAQLDDTRGALVQEVDKNAALTKAADAMESSMLGAYNDLCTASATADLIPVEMRAMMTLDNALATYRKLKESKNDDNACS
jgi:propanediol dehydratase large subunit